MAHILIVGGAGFVGSHCAKTAAAAGHTVVVLDSLVTGHREFVRWGPLVEGDVRDAALLRTVMADNRFDAVMHFAARAYVGESVIAPADYYDVNIGGTRTLLGAMVDAGIKHLVFSSTCAVYGQPDHMPITEATALAPINPYGFTKLVCERMIEDYARAYGVSAIKLRYFNAAGADPACEIGEDHNPEPHLIPLVLDTAMGRRPAISVFGNDYPTSDGTAIRDYIHVADLADAHVRAISHLIDGGETRSINLGTGKGVSVAQLIAAASEVCEREVVRIMAPRRSGDPQELVADPALALRVLDWRASRSDIRLILADAWRWHKLRFGTTAGLAG